MREKLEKNRWILLVFAMLCQCVCNFPSAWAVFQPYVAQQYGYSSSAATLVMPMCVAAFGIMSIFGGRVQDHSPKLAGVIGAVMLTLSFVNAWWVPAGNPLYMYIGFSFLFGGGCGFLFQAIFMCTLKWYADKKGSVSGLVGAVSGVYIIGLTYVANWMLKAVGARTALLIMGIFSGAIAFGVLFVLVAPTRAYIEEKDAQGRMKQASRGGVAKPRPATAIVDFTPGEVLRTGQYYFLALSVLLGIPAFQLISPQLVSICTARGLAQNVAVSAVAVGSAFTALGRFAIPRLSDRVGRKPVKVAMSALVVVCAVAFLKARGLAILGVWACMCFCYSGGFAVNSSMTNDMFGFKYAGTNSGLVNLSNTIGSLVGPMLLTAFTPLWGDSTASYVGIAGGALSLVCLVLLNPNTARAKARLEEKARRRQAEAVK